MKRKITSLITILVLLVSVVLPASAASAVEGNVKFKVSSAKVLRGEDFNFTISMSDFEAIRGFQTGITFDNNKVEFVGAEFDDAVSDAGTARANAETEGVVGIAVALDEATELNGDIVVLNFKVKEDAASGLVDFGLTSNGVEVTDKDNLNVDVNISFDSVSVKYDYETTITAKASEDIVYNNSELVYTLSVTELKAMRGVAFEVIYDDDLLELKSAEAKGSVATECYTEPRVDVSSAGKVDVAAEFEDKTDLSGDILELKFKVLPDKEAKEYNPISVSKFEAVTGESKKADLYWELKADSVEVSRKSYIEMSYLPEKPEVDAGDEIKYTVTLDRIETSRGFQAELLYDADKLEILRVEKGDVLNDAENVSGIITDKVGKIDFVCAYDSAKVSVGTVAVIVFKVKDGVSAGYVEMSALKPMAVDDNYDFIDAEGINNIEKVYVGRLARKYNLKLSADKEIYASGDVMSLTADMGDVDNFLGVQFAIYYNPEKFTYVKPAKKSEYFGEMMKSSDARAINSTKTDEGKAEILVSFGTANPYSGNGEVCTLKFIANTDVTGYEDITLGSIIPKTGDTVIAENTRVYISAGDSIKATENLIESIGTIDIASGELISSARAKYDSLTDMEKSAVNNYDKLVSAENAYKAVKAIGDIGEVTLDKKSKIDEARNLYEELSDADKLLVSNYVVLQLAETKYEELLPNFEYSVEEHGGVINLSVKNVKYNGNAWAVIAQYSASGSLVSVKTNEIVALRGETKTYTCEKDGETATTKIFIWSDLTSMIPLI